MIRRLSSALGAGALVVLASSLPASAAATPRVSLSDSTVSPGQSVTVRGTGFPDLIDVLAQVCGNDALDASADCALSSSQEISTTSNGQFQLGLVVRIPPVPCPCVVLITSEHLDTTPSVAIDIVGAPTAPLRSTAVPSVTEPLHVTAVGLSGWGPWTAWFGAQPKRTLELRVHNPNTAAYQDPPLVVRQGRPGQPGEVVSTQDVGTFAPGATRTLRVPVTLSPLSFGTEEVHGTLGFSGYSTTFSDKTVVVPWGLIAAVLVLAQLILVGFRNRVRRRLRREADRAAAAAAAAAEEPGGVPVVLMASVTPHALAGASARIVPVALVPAQEGAGTPSSSEPVALGPFGDHGQPRAGADAVTIRTRQLPLEPLARPGPGPGQMAEGQLALLSNLGRRLAEAAAGDVTPVVALVELDGAGGDGPNAAALPAIERALRAQLRAEDVLVTVGPSTLGVICIGGPRRGPDAAPDSDPAARLATRLAEMADEALAALALPARTRAVAVSAPADARPEASEMVRQVFAGMGPR